mmetsp:Transcript_33609/g.57653  ORF Transcript_33609/g.57653 Transcript_33609/m.57653 type:complete len:217 (-) Transcript_33609:453-1103(-)
MSSSRFCFSKKARLASTCAVRDATVSAYSASRRAALSLNFLSSLSLRSCTCRSSKALSALDRFASCSTAASIMRCLATWDFSKRSFSRRFRAALRASIPSTCASRSASAAFSSAISCSRIDFKSELALSMRMLFAAAIFFLASISFISAASEAMAFSFMAMPFSRSRRSCSSLRRRTSSSCSKRAILISPTSFRVFSTFSSSRAFKRATSAMVFSW